MLPSYLALGMPYDLFWHGDPYAVRPFREAGRVSMRRADAVAWIQGRYVYDALVSVASGLAGGRATPYVEVPYLSRTEEGDRQRELQRRLENGRAAIADMKVRFARARAFNDAHGGGVGTIDGTDEEVHGV